MNLENNKPIKKSAPVPKTDDFDIDFEFKPITSGLGFHHQKTTSDVKPSVAERASMPAPQSMQTIQVRPVAPVKADMNVYQNDLSLFYGQAQQQLKEALQEKIEDRPLNVVRLATPTERVFAYVLDLVLLTSVLSLVLVMMARATDMDIIQAWNEYPNEITPLVISLFLGFYVTYFSIFEKSASSTLGKGLLGIRVVDENNQDQRFIVLVLRTVISLANFISLGLFSYFDLQNKATSSKVIRND